jgi:hypothetical protein
MYEQPYGIAGLAVSDVLSYLSERDLSCQGPTPRPISTLVEIPVSLHQRT